MAQAQHSELSILRVFRHFLYLFFVWGLVTTEQNTSAQREVTKTVRSRTWFVELWRVTAVARVNLGAMNTHLEMLSVSREG